MISGPCGLALVSLAAASVLPFTRRCVRCRGGCTVGAGCERLGSESCQKYSAASACETAPMVPAAVRITTCQNRSLGRALFETRRRLTRIILISSLDYWWLLQTQNAFTRTRLQQTAVFAPSVAKKPHITLNPREIAGSGCDRQPSGRGTARLHGSERQARRGRYSCHFKPEANVTSGADPGPQRCSRWHYRSPHPPWRPMSRT